jgi:ornithine cyclodeaminase/alanine dehydrogenase-like protein (mu-crystallin family)
MAATEAQLKASEERRFQLRQTLLQRKSEQQRAEASFAESVNLFVAAALDSLRIQTDRADIVSAATAAERDRLAPLVLQGYRDWLSDAHMALEDVEHVEERGMIVPDADEFRAAVRRIRVLVDNSDRLQAADRHAAEGRVVPLREAFDELRRRPGA